MNFPERSPTETGERVVFWGILGMLLINVVLIVLVASSRDSAAPLAIAYIGWLVAECGLCCTAFQRTASLRFWASILLAALMILSLFAGIGILMLQGNARLGETFLFGIFSLSLIGLFWHTVPLLILKWLVSRVRARQFSLWQIMLLMTVIAVISMLFTLAGPATVRIAGALVFALGPSVISGIALNFIDRSIYYLPVMLLQWVVVVTITIVMLPGGIVLGVYLIPQLLACTIGGLLLIQIPRTRRVMDDQSESSAERTESPFDAPSEIDFS